MNQQVEVEKDLNKNFNKSSMLEGRKGLFKKFLAFFSIKQENMMENEIKKEVIPEKKESLKEKRATTQIELLIDNEMFLLLQQLKENNYILSKEQEEKINTKMFFKLKNEGFNFLEKAKKEGLNIPNSVLALYMFQVPIEDIIVTKYEIDKEEKRKEELFQKFLDEDLVNQELEKEKIAKNDLITKKEIQDKYLESFSYVFDDLYCDDLYYENKLKEKKIIKMVLEYLNTSNIKTEFNSPYNTKYINNVSSFKTKETKNIEYLERKNKINRKNTYFFFNLLEEKCKDEGFQEEVWRIFKDIVNNSQKKLGELEKENLYSMDIKNTSCIKIKDIEIDTVSSILMMTNYIIPNIKNKIDFYEYLEITDKVKKIKESIVKLIKKPMKEHKVFETKDLEIVNLKRIDNFIRIQTKNEDIEKEIQKKLYHLDSTLKDMDYLMHNFFSIEKGDFIKKFSKKSDDLIKINNIEFLPNEYQVTIKEIQKLFLNYTKNKGLLDYVEELEIEDTVNNKIPYVIDRYLKLEESHRDILKNAQGKTANELLKDALSNILIYLKEKDEKINEALLSDLSIAQRITSFKIK